MKKIYEADSKHNRGKTHTPFWRTARFKEVFSAYPFIAPTILELIIFIVIPISFSFYLSFHRWNLSGQISFIGFGNYKNLISDREFWSAMVNTFYYTMSTVPVTMVISLIFALALNAKIKGLAIYRASYFMPVITSVVAGAFIWSWIFQSHNGALNHILSWVGIKPLKWLNEPKGIIELVLGHYGIKPIRFLRGPSLSLVAIIIMSIWKNLGYSMVIYLAGLKNIPAHLYEAADIDGAGRWAKFRHITFPGLGPATYFILVMSTITSFQAFGQVAVMTKGGPLDRTTVIVYYIYQEAFKFFEMGYASATAYILFGVILLLTIFQTRYLGQRIHY